MSEYMCTYHESSDGEPRPYCGKCRQIQLKNDVSYHPLTFDDEYPTRPQRTPPVFIRTIAAIRLYVKRIVTRVTFTDSQTNNVSEKQ